MTEREEHGEAGLLALQALRYTRGVLGRVEADAFEARLEGDQRARDALCRAVELVADFSGLGAVRPNPAYRERVRRRLEQQK
ncbi:MAG TPA: hypothetical protein VEL76_22005 [Gemmataceae bacterium]|nr:hypothetical protein [Gemmataceae bacterium]